MSKASAELVRESWYRAFFAGDSRLGHVARARAGNVIGGGDYAEDRLLPDCVRALIKHKPIPVRNPASVRAWLHVLDCLSGYLWLGARLGREPKGGPLACAFNFGPEGDACQSAQALVKEVLKHWPGEWRDISDPAQVHEARVLKLCTDRAWALLNWRPTLCFEDSVELAMTWYRRRHAGPPTDMLEFSLRQIEDYCAKATTRMLPWADAPR
jgi:CDP-glucose 4,6-dehydratase